MLLEDGKIVLMATSSFHEMISFCAARTKKMRKENFLITWVDATQVVFRVSWPVAKLPQEMTPGSGMMVRRAEQGGEEQCITREVVAKLRGIGGIK